MSDKQKAIKEWYIFINDFLYKNNKEYREDEDKFQRNLESFFNTYDVKEEDREYLFDLINNSYLNIIDLIALCPLIDFKKEKINEE